MVEFSKHGLFRFLPFFVGETSFHSPYIQDDQNSPNFDKPLDLSTNIQGDNLPLEIMYDTSLFLDTIQRYEDTILPCNPNDDVPLNISSRAEGGSHNL